MSSASPPALGTRPGVVVIKNIVALSIDTVDWSSIKWDSIKWDAIKWDVIKWDVIKWDSIKWDAIKWDSIKWDSIKWDSIMAELRAPGEQRQLRNARKSRSTWSASRRHGHKPLSSTRTLVSL